MPTPSATQPKPGWVYFGRVQQSRRWLVDQRPDGLGPEVRNSEETQLKEVGRRKRVSPTTDRVVTSSGVEVAMVVMFQGKEGRKYQNRSRSGKEEKRERRCMAG